MEMIAKIPQIEPQDAHLLLQEDTQAKILDVREPHECEICQIPESIKIPMHEIPERLQELSTDELLIVMCHHGGRSQNVAQWLAMQGRTRIYNLVGGIDRWAQEIDPSLRRY
ncbi:MAG: rhodanese-like domain-containing protein [Pseudomonadota bacterium]